MDLLDFEAKDLYFNQEDSVEVQELIRQASQDYASGDAELPLLKAFLRAPESLNVLVSLNRYYYYQHRLEDALLISERALNIVKAKLEFPENWQDLQLQDITSAPKDRLSWIRLYLFTLKSIGFLNMRLYNFALSQAVFEKLVMLDQEDRIGAAPLLFLVEQKIQESASAHA